MGRDAGTTGLQPRCRTTQDRSGRSAPQVTMQSRVMALSCRSGTRAAGRGGRVGRVHRQLLAALTLTIAMTAAACTDDGSSEGPVSSTTTTTTTTTSEPLVTGAVTLAVG